ncbi:MAG: BCCT family transporter, partial [Pseudomonadota bacterium]
MTDQTTIQGIPEPDGHAAVIETDYQIGQDNIKAQVGPLGLDIHNPVFLISGLSIVAFVFYALALPEQAEAIFGALRPWLTSTFSWFFIASGNIMVLFCLFLIVSPWGAVRIGGNDATPDYSYPGWFAMLFAAGMGIGLMFYGVSEPMSHFSTALGGTTVEGGARTDWAPLGAAAGDQQTAIALGMAATIYHWALHPWGMYAVVALALALFTYNKGLPLTIRSAFYPIFGDRVWGWTGHIIDTLAVFA